MEQGMVTQVDDLRKDIEMARTKMEVIRSKHSIFAGEAIVHECMEQVVNPGFSRLESKLRAVIFSMDKLPQSDPELVAAKKNLSDALDAVIEALKLMRKYWNETDRAGANEKYKIITAYQKQILWVSAG